MLLNSHLLSDSASDVVLRRFEYSVDLNKPLTSLSHCSRWEKLPQELKIPRAWLVAFFVSEEIVQCSFKDNYDDDEDKEELQLKN